MSTALNLVLPWVYGLENCSASQRVPNCVIVRHDSAFPKNTCLASVEHSSEWWLIALRPPDLVALPALCGSGRTKGRRVDRSISLLSVLTFFSMDNCLRRGGVSLASFRWRTFTSHWDQC